jgi:hypothetical protein
MAKLKDIEAPRAQIIALLKAWATQRQRIDDAEFRVLMAQFEAANEAVIEWVDAEVVGARERMKLKKGLRWARTMVRNAARFRGMSDSLREMTTRGVREGTQRLMAMCPQAFSDRTPWLH